MLPVFAIVGRPNVGKSTLFNRLTKTRNAIVGDVAGITRDRHYGHAFLEERPFIVVDTGGIAETDDPAMAHVTEMQVEAAIGEADVVLFLVDSKAGLAHGDVAIAKKMRSLVDKRVVLVVNKADRETAAGAAGDFYSLGFKTIYSIAANTGRGLEAMLTELLAQFPVDETEEKPDDVTRIRVAVLGRPNVGKSTLINRILGEERVIVFDRPGTTRDSIYIPYDRLDKKYTLIDTAGIRRRGKIDEAIETYSVIKAMQAMRTAHVVILVVDARDGLTEQDMRLLGLILEAGNALIFAFNKWDNMSEDDRESLKNTIDRKLPFATFARRYFISAKHGTGVGNLYHAIDEIQTGLSQTFATNELTRILMAATEEHQPPLAKGRRVKLRYAHVGSRHPLTFVVHGKQVDKLPGSYKQFLIGYFRKALNLTGIPLILKWIGDDNPFVDDGVKEQKKAH